MAITITSDENFLKIDDGTRITSIQKDGLFIDIVNEEVCIYTPTNSKYCIDYNDVSSPSVASAEALFELSTKFISHLIIK